MAAAAGRTTASRRVDSPAPKAAAGPPGPAEAAAAGLGLAGEPPEAEGDAWPKAATMGHLKISGATLAGGIAVLALSFALPGRLLSHSAFLLGLVVGIVGGVLLLFYAARVVRGGRGLHEEDGSLRLQLAVARLEACKLGATKYEQRLAQKQTEEAVIRERVEQRRVEEASLRRRVEQLTSELKSPEATTTPNEDGWWRRACLAVREMHPDQVAATVVLCAAGALFLLMSVWCVWRMGKVAYRVVAVWLLLIMFSRLPLWFLRVLDRTKKKWEERKLSAAANYPRSAAALIAWQKGRTWFKRLLGLVLVCAAMAFFGLAAAPVLAALLLFLFLTHEPKVIKKKK